MIDKKKIGKTIAFYRKSVGMTQKELAEILHISYQAVSKWEAGVSLPTVEMLCEIVNVLGVSIDEMLRREEWTDGVSIYKEAGLDTIKLHTLKEQLEELTTKDKNLLNARYTEPVIYRVDTSGMKEPVHAMVTAIPGSKARLAKERGLDREICVDTAANAANAILSYGMKPVVLKGSVVCGNNNGEQLRNMAQALQKVCEENDIMFAGMEIGAQPMNYKPDEYELQVEVAGVGDLGRLVTGENIQKGDVLLGLVTEGINAVNYPVIKMMIDKNPSLVHAKIDGEHYFGDELLKPNTAFCHAIALLVEEGIPHGIFKTQNLVDKKMCKRIPKELGVRIDLASLPVLPLYQFLLQRKMIMEDMMPYCFQMGIGMTVVVPEEKKARAMDIIGGYHDCYCIGRIETYRKQKHPDRRIWVEGQIRW